MSTIVSYYLTNDNIYGMHQNTIVQQIIQVFDEQIL